jgi:hypothetical protein
MSLVETLERGFLRARLASVGAHGYPIEYRCSMCGWTAKYTCITPVPRDIYALTSSAKHGFASRLTSRVKPMPMAVLSATHRCPICSVIAFGTIRIVEEQGSKQRFFEALMAKHEKRDLGPEAQGILPASRPNRLLCNRSSGLQQRDRAT